MFYSTKLVISEPVGLTLTSIDLNHVVNHASLWLTINNHRYRLSIGTMLYLFKLYFRNWFYTQAFRHNRGIPRGWTNRVYEDLF